MDKKSLYGYKRNSPYRNSPFLDIQTPEGLIDMSETPHDILGMTPEGEVQYMQAGSQNPYRFNSSTVREIPVKKKGGTYESRYYKWKYQQGGTAKQLYDFLFEDDEDEYQEQGNVPTAPAEDEIAPEQEQQRPEQTSDEDLAISMIMEDSYSRVPRSRRTSLGNPYPENQDYTNVAPANVNSTAKQAFEYYKEKGVPPHVAAGIVGNLVQESGLNPTVKGDNGLATGAAQWHPDRFKALQSWAKASGKNPYSLNTQLDYVLVEANQRGDMAHLMNTKTSAEAAYVFAKKFERPKIIDKNRIAYAKKLY